MEYFLANRLRSIFPLSENESLRTIGEDIGVAHRTLLTWVKQHEYKGSVAFLKQYTNYTVQIKLDVLNYMTEHGKPCDYIL